MTIWFHVVKENLEARKLYDSQESTTCGISTCMSIACAVYDLMKPKRLRSQLMQMQQAPRMNSYNHSMCSHILLELNVFGI